MEFEEDNDFIYVLAIDFSCCHFDGLYKQC